MPAPECRSTGGMRRLLVVSLLALAALAPADEASGSCAAAVVIDGRLLFGGEAPYPRRVPPRAGERDAIFPACNDGGPIEEDHEGTVVRLRGVPPQIAVAGAMPGSVYVDEASLTVIGTHPLHAAFHGRPGAPSYRSGRACRAYRTVVRGRVAEDGALRIRTARRTVSVRVDAATRYTNRPVYEPVLKGQRLRLATSRCGPRRVADRVTFLGAPPRPAAYRGWRAAGGGFHVAGWVIVVLALMAGAAGLIGVLWRVLGH
jgi:hypothetical protein